MVDYNAILSRSRNALLSPQLSRRDALRAGIQATTGVPYADARSQILADQYNRALSGYQIGSAERDFETRRDQQLWDRAQKEAQRGDDNAAKLLELAGAYGANAADSQRLAAAVVGRTKAEDINDASMLPGLVAEEAERLGLEARPELTLMSTAGGGVVGIDPLARAQTIIEGQTEAPAPYTDIGKINADLTAGLINSAQALQAAGALYADDGVTWSPLTEAQREAYQIPLGQPAQISSDGKVHTIGSGGVTVVNTEERQYDKSAGEAFLNAQVAAQESLAIADNLESVSGQLRNVLERAETGTLRGGIAAITALGDDLGVDVPAVAGRLGINLDDPADAQTIRRLSAGLILERMQGLRDARPSDRDLALITDASAGLLRTREDNLRYLQAVDNSIKRIRDMAEIARTAEDWRQYQDRMAEWRSNNPITTYTGPRYVEMPDGRTGYYDDDLGWFRYDDTNEEMPR